MKIALMFSGQGSQYVGMCKDLYDEFESVKNIFKQADEILGYSITKIIFENELLLNQTIHTQVAMYTMYAAILEVLKEKNIHAEYSIGLSLGEYGAMLHNEIFTFEQGLLLLKKRGEVMNETSLKVNGKMSAILGMDADTLINIISNVSGYVKISNYNTYGQLVISGEESAVMKVNELALEQGAKRAILLNTSGPFHTDLMKEASDQLKDYISNLSFEEPIHTLLLNTTGDYYQSDIKNEMVNQITSSVMFYQMVEKLLDDNVDTFIEIGPRKSLCSFVKKVNRKATMLNIEDISSLEKTVQKLEE